MKTYIADRFKTTDGRRLDQNSYNVKDYGALGDGSTDDTSAIQTTINTCFATGGGVVYFPIGVYIIGGALLNDVGAGLTDYNSQLYIPEVNYTDALRTTIELIGEVHSNFVQTAGISVVTTPNSGVILRSTIQGSGIAPSVICSRGRSTNYEQVNYTNLVVKNLAIQVTPNGSSKITIGGINCYYSKIANFENVNIFPYNTNLVNSGKPDVIEVSGIAMPKINCELNNTIRNCQVGGFTNGYLLGEHGSLYDAVAICCTNGFNQTANFHLGNYQKIAAYWCSVDFIVTGASFFNVANLQTEWSAQSKWYDATTTLSDVSNLGRGKFNFNIVQAGVGVNNDKYTKIGGLNVSASPVSLPAMVNSQTGTFYELKYSDAFRLSTFDNASPILVRVPNNTTVPFDIGARIQVKLVGAGKITLDGSAGVSFVYDTGVPLEITSKNSIIEAIQTTPNVWNVSLIVAGTSGIGDMVLASAQTNSGLKTFLNGTFGLRNVANTFTSVFSNAATASRTWTLPNRNGTLADDTDLAGKMANPSGTANYLSKFLTATTIGLSRIFDTGTYIGIGTANAPTKDITLGNQANREIGIEESANTSPGRDLKITAGRTINYVPSTAFLPLSQTSRNWTELTSYLNGDIYANVSASRYKQTAGGGDFIVDTSTPNFSDTTVNPSTGDVWGCVNGGGIWKQTAGTGSFVDQGQTTRGWKGICFRVGGDLYASVDGGDIYKSTGGGTFTATGQTSRAWGQMTCTVGGDVYSFASTVIYKMTAGAGTMTAQTASAAGWQTISASKINNDVYIAAYGGDIHKQTSATGSFVAIGGTFRSWTSIECAFNGNIYASAAGGDIYMQNNNTLGTADLNGGTLKLSAGTGKGTGTSKIQLTTGAKTTSGTDMQSETIRMEIDENGLIKATTMPAYADNTAALAGGLVAGQFYRTSTGILMITY